MEGLSFGRSLGLLWTETAALRCCCLRSPVGPGQQVVVAIGDGGGGCSRGGSGPGVMTRRQQPGEHGVDYGGEVGVSDDGQEWESEEVDRLNEGTSGYSLRGKESAAGFSFFSLSLSFFEVVRSCRFHDRLK